MSSIHTVVVQKKEYIPTSKYFGITFRREGGFTPTPKLGVSSRSERACPQRSRLRGGRGFTLIELLVVIAIIGILASIIVAALSNAQLKARDGRRVADISQIQRALELYGTDNSSLYPPGTVLTPLTTGGYIPVIPSDPFNRDLNVYTYQALNALNAACPSSPCVSFVLKAVLENESLIALDSDVDSTLGGISCTDPAYCITP